ncbi:MAG: Gfo/Idh/MocA family oxidoreductase [Candidatus Hydrogenedentes bacterium]|nr:Gfo/Idh/MocA family oxidoreductase [Candidatus Hydrogenedentota bacterium]
MDSKHAGSISRRTFLGGVTAAAVAPYIIPASALGAEDTVAPSERITIGLIGCGGQGRGITENAIKHKNTQLVAVCDVDQTRLNEAKGMVDQYYSNQDCATYADYRELIARDDIDALLIATPDHWHALVSIEGAKHKKDMYCEKPLTWSLGAGQAVVKAVKENGVVFQTGSMQRSDNKFKHACQLVRNGYLGKIQRILVALPDFGNAVWVDSFPVAPPELNWEMYVGPAEWTPFHPQRYHWDWRWWMSFGGGQMMDWIGHHGDIAHMGMDWDNTGPKKVEGIRWEFGKERNNLYNSPAHYMFRCEYKGGVEMIVANASDMPEDFVGKGNLGTMFIGTDGRWCYVDRSGMEVSHDELKRNPFKKDDFKFRKENNHMTDFLNCVVSREETIAPVNAGHRSASIGHLGKLACVLGASFEWDPEKEVIIDNPALNSMLTRKYRGEWSLDA